MAFNHPTLVSQSWYVAARSRALCAGEAKSCDLLQRRIVLYRDARGTAHALDAHCPHLGADLGHGKVVGELLQCAFHGWRFGPDGKCQHSGGSKTAGARSYPVTERWGLIWLFNGPRALFDLPDDSTAKGLRAWRLPPQRINCHPHLVIANGLDVTHYETLHGMRFAEPPHLTAPTPFTLRLSLRGRPRTQWQQRLTGTGRCDLAASFTTFGGNLAWVTVTEPLRFHILFTGRPTSGGACETQTILFAAPHQFPRALALMFVLLYDDRRILDSIRFTPNFTEQDAPLKAFAEVVSSLGVW